MWDEMKYILQDLWDQRKDHLLYNIPGSFIIFNHWLEKKWLHIGDSLDSSEWAGCHTWHPHNGLVLTKLYMDWKLRLKPC